MPINCFQPWQKILMYAFMLVRYDFTRELPGVIIFLKERKDLASHRMPGNFMTSLIRFIKTTSKFKEVKTEHFLFRYVEDKDAILVDYALNTLEKGLSCSWE